MKDKNSRGRKPPKQNLVNGPPPVNVVRQLQILLGLESLDPAAAAVPEEVLMNGPPPPLHVHVLEAFEIYGPRPAIPELVEFLWADNGAIRWLDRRARPKLKQVKRYQKLQQQPPPPPPPGVC